MILCQGNTDFFFFKFKKAQVYKLWPFSRKLTQVKWTVLVISQRCFQQKRLDTLHTSCLAPTETEQTDQLFNIAYSLSLERWWRPNIQLNVDWILFWNEDDLQMLKSSTHKKGTKPVTMDMQMWYLSWPLSAVCWNETKEEVKRWTEELTVWV